MAGMHQKNFEYGRDILDTGNVLALANGSIQGGLSPGVIQKIRASEQKVRDIVSQPASVYGINTGFGILANTKISEADTRVLQYKILQSHSVGVGNPVPAEIARIMLVTKVHALAQGYSGVQLATLERILWHMEEDIIPVVPEKGSVGASGDLAPLSHLFLPLIGLGEVYHRGQRRATRDVLEQYGLSPVALGPKEGLALINGTQFILAYAVKAVERLHYCLEAADIIGAMSLEALTGTKAPFDERLHRLRPFAGSLLVAQRLRHLLKDSAIMQEPCRLRPGAGPLFPAMYAAGTWRLPECVAASAAVDGDRIECRDG
jgi:histidine ammonia-lyase